MACYGDDYSAPNTVGQPEMVSPANSAAANAGVGPVKNNFLDYLRASLAASNRGGMNQGASARGGFTPSPTDNNLGKAAGAASQAGLCGGGAGAAAGAL